MSSPALPTPGQVRPRGTAFLIPVGIFLLGLVLMVVLIVNGFRRTNQIVDDFDRVSVGESETFDLEAGGYRVWIEGPGVDEGFELVEYNIVSADDGDPLVTSSFTGSLTYTLSGHTATAFETFDLDESGEYEVTLDSVSSGRSDRNLAIGQDNPLRAIVRGIVFGILAAVLGFIVALVVAIVLFVKRGKSKRAMAGQPGPPAGGYGYGYGYPPQGYPPQGSRRRATRRRVTRRRVTRRRVTRRRVTRSRRRRTPRRHRRRGTRHPADTHGLCSRLGFERDANGGEEVSTNAGRRPGAGGGGIDGRGRRPSRPGRGGTRLGHDRREPAGRTRVPR